MNSGHWNTRLPSSSALYGALMRSFRLPQNHIINILTGLGLRSEVDVHLNISHTEEL